MPPRTAPFPAQGNACPYTDRNHGGKHQTAGSCQFGKFKKGIKDEHGKDDRAVPYSMITVAKDKKDRISAAGEMPYFSLLHLLIWY